MDVVIVGLLGILLVVTENLLKGSRSFDAGNCQLLDAAESLYHVREEVERPFAWPGLSATEIGLWNFAETRS